MESIHDSEGRTEHKLVADNEMLTAMYITQRRIYDVLARLLANINPEDADILMQMHEQGIFATSDPTYLAQEEENDNDDTAGAQSAPAS